MHSVEIDAKVYQTAPVLCWFVIASLVVIAFTFYAFGGICLYCIVQQDNSPLAEGYDKLVLVIFLSF